MLYLTIEDIIPNSIIELEKIDGRTNITIEEAKKYGEEVAKHLTKRGYYTKLKLNPGLIESFEIKYSNFFEKYYDDNTFGYRLNKEKDIEELISIFRTPLVFEVIESFTNQEVINNSIGKKDNYITLTKSKILREKMMNKDEYYMKKALKEAKKAYSKDEVPIGCIIVKNNKIIAKSYNQKTIKNIATYHAEVLAINKACKSLNTWYLDDCILYTTVEPCLMCTGAIIQSRISKVVYGTKNESFGYLSKAKKEKIIKIETKGNVLKEECSNILTEFFKEKENN